MAESKGNDRRARKMLAGLGDLPGRLLVWLGGLDSNQDNQIQNLMYCQLYDLPIFWKLVLNNFSESSARKQF